MAKPYSSAKAYLGDAALTLGCIGFLLFTLGIPLAIFGAHFWVGMGFREGPQPSQEQLHAAIARDVWWIVWHRLVPLLAVSLALLGYGSFQHYVGQQTPELPKDRS